MGLLLLRPFRDSNFVPAVSLPVTDGGARRELATGDFGPRGIRQLPVGAAATLRFAFFAENEAASFQALEQNATSLDALLPDWLEIATSKGELVLPSRSEVRTRSWLQANSPHTGTFPLLSSRLPTRDMISLLAHPDSRERLVVKLALVCDD